MSNVKGIDATYYTTANLDRAVDFYINLLGSEPNLQVPGRLAEWTFGDDSSFGLYCIPEYKGSRGGSVMFAVPDLEAAMRDAKARGVRFDDDEVTNGTHCKMCFGRDADDNQFILHQVL